MSQVLQLNSLAHNLNYPTRGFTKAPKSLFLWEHSFGGDNSLLKGVNSTQGGISSGDHGSLTSSVKVIPARCSFYVVCVRSYPFTGRDNTNTYWRRLSFYPHRRRTLSRSFLLLFLRPDDTFPPYIELTPSIHPTLEHLGTHPVSHKRDYFHKGDHLFIKGGNSTLLRKNWAVLPRRPF